MKEQLRDPIDHSTLVSEPAGLRSAAGRLYPTRAGGWDLRPEAAVTAPIANAAHDAAHAAAQAEIYDAMTGELTDFDHPHNLTLLHQRSLLEGLPLDAGDRVLEIGGHRSGVLGWLERHRGVHGIGIDISI